MNLQESKMEPIGGDCNFTVVGVFGETVLVYCSYGPEDIRVPVIPVCCSGADYQMIQQSFNK